MITLLKLGGSLITEKDKPRHAREEVIRRLGLEIRDAIKSRPELQIILGHGSGSFGHTPAKKYRTREGVHTRSEWAGFAEVHHEASTLNQKVIDIFFDCGLPCLTITPLSAVEAKDGAVTSWNLSPIKTALEKGMIPVVYGDTVFDTVRGGTILSTEDLFVHLAGEIKEQFRVLLAGLEEGLWEDFPQRTKLIRSFNVTGYPDSKVEFIQGSLYPDVTGGMREKVHLVSDLICHEKIGSALIFSGEISLNVKNALLGETPGTILVSGTNR